MVIVVRGIGDIGSAIAHRLFRAGYRVVINDVPTPRTIRRGMSFGDAVFDGHAMLDGVHAVRAHDLVRVRETLEAGRAIAVYVRDIGSLVAGIRPAVLVDARMQKHSRPEIQHGLAPLTIALGPDRVAGRHADVVIETSWNGLGEVISQGRTRPLSGEPREIAGHGRDRYVYAPLEGVFRTKRHIGENVQKGQEVAAISALIVVAPLDGVLRGLVRDGVPVTVGTKLIEVDPRVEGAEIYGIAERPRLIGESVLTAIRGHRPIG
jgi:xanthine dehydrogenase accessory factor